MLHMLGQAQLARSLFPVGGLPKAETRALARAVRTAGRLEAGLPGALLRARAATPAASSGAQAPALVHAGGEVVDADGRVLAEHDGTFAFTVGQRRGLGVATGVARCTSRDRRRREPRRGRPGGAAAPSARLEADRVSWVAGGPPGDGPFEAEVRVRYRGRGRRRGRHARRAERVRRGVPVRRSAPSRPGRARSSTAATRLLGGGRIVAAA